MFVGDGTEGGSERVADAAADINLALHNEVSSAERSSLAGGSRLDVRQEYSSIQARAAGIRELRLSPTPVRRYSFVPLFIYLSR